MKKYIDNFKSTVKYSVSIIASREFAFIYCLLGTIGQIAHTYFLMNNISSLEGGWKITQAIMLSVFISSSLLYFTAISDNAETKEAKRIHFAVTLFTIIEILINIYYYSRLLVLEKLDKNGELGYGIFDFIFALLISCLIPVTIKLYSSHIRAKEWIADVENEDKTEKNIEEIDTTNFVSREEFEQLENDVDEILNTEKSVSGISREEFVEAVNELKNELVVDIDKIIESPKFQELISAQKEQPSSVEIDMETLVKEVLSNLPERELKENLFDPIAVENLVKETINNKLKEIDNQITESFEKNSAMFLQQYKNKIQSVNNRAEL